MSLDRAAALGFGEIRVSAKGGAVELPTRPIRDRDLLEAVTAAVRMDQGRRQEIARDC